MHICIIHKPFQTCKINALPGWKNANYCVVCAALHINLECTFLGNNVPLRKGKPMDKRIKVCIIYT